MKRNIQLKKLKVTVKSIHSYKKQLCTYKKRPSCFLSRWSESKEKILQVNCEGKMTEPVPRCRFSGRLTMAN